ncbi:glycosyltransferase family 4 protein [uncultured Erythrobacter sp.]|uniref:glycosyltransferase family 4 protein n=1 Tax=uncultured Erythrobacter sp. TaxID=263913 RepID=UPI002611E061|nr:glycosyltransferase [uncultured Erythrobacter sp.]
MTSRILHVSGDFPDPIEAFKTPVIKSLLELTADTFQHEVISLNRVTPSLLRLASLLLNLSGDGALIQNEQLFEFGRCLEYNAPGGGILHRTMLDRVGRHLANIVDARESPIDLIVGHKLTIEGIVVAKAAHITGIPYALTIQGNTDRRILDARPDLRGLFRSIYQGARAVSTFTPVAKVAIEGMLGTRPDGIELIPCPTELDGIVEPQDTNGNVISVFHLKNHEVKNLKGLADAATQLVGEEAERRITIIGGGSHAELARCKLLTAKAMQIDFAGPIERDAMQSTMNEACALVLPSHDESFGLVFIEALFAGLPIIYPKNTAIDGYFGDQPFAQGVDASSPKAIAEAINRAIREESKMKKALTEWQRSGAAQFFTRARIAERYARALRSAVAY